MTVDLAAAQWQPDKILWGLNHFKAKNKILHLKIFHMTSITAA